MLAGCSEAQSQGSAGEQGGDSRAATQAGTGTPAASSPPAGQPSGPAASGLSGSGGSASAKSGTAQAAGPTATATPAGGVRDITFDDVKFELQPGEPFQRSMLGPKIEQLSGSKIRVRGYIHPQSVFTLTDISAFVLVRDNQQCCFGPGAMLYDSMMVYMQGGRTTNFTDRPITVEGVFQIEELVGPDGKHYSIYRVDAVSAG